MHTWLLSQSGTAALQIRTRFAIVGRRRATFGLILGESFRSTLLVIGIISSYGHKDSLIVRNGASNEHRRDGHLTSLTRNVQLL